MSATLNIPHETTTKTPEKRWIINQQGLDKFHQLTDPPFFQLDESLGVDLVYAKCMNKLKETMGKCFKEREIRSSNDIIFDNDIRRMVKHLKMFGKKGKAQKKEKKKVYIFL